MKKILISIFFFSILISSIFAQTNVSGGIYNNTTWTLANSPYLITGPIVVFPSKTLTIEPGVVVKVQGGFSSTTGYPKNYLEIRGNLVAVGTANAPIIFAIDSTNSPSYWYGIVIKSAQGATASLNYFTLDHSYYGIDNQNTNATDSISLKGCTFSNNLTAFAITGPLSLDSCFFINNINTFKGSQYAINATNCTFSDNQTAVGYFGTATNLTNCIFENNEFAIVSTAGGLVTGCAFNNNIYGFFDNYANNFTISNCTFTNNLTAINLIKYSSITNSQFSNNTLAMAIGEGMLVQNCDISNNEVGIKTWGQFMPGQLIMEVKDNQICNNTLYNIENATDLNLGLEKNCFCSTDSTVIENLIYDGYDDITRGLYNYAIYDSACQNIVTFVTKVDLVYTSIEKETTLSNFTLSPNPSATSIKAETQNPKMFNTSLQILDMNGRIVKANLTYTDGIALIEVSDLPNGIYMLIENASANRQLFVKQ
jgi:hypothetical protein